MSSLLIAFARNLFRLRRDLSRDERQILVQYPLFVAQDATSLVRERDWVRGSQASVPLKTRHKGKIDVFYPFHPGDPPVYGEPTECSR